MQIIDGKLVSDELKRKIAAESLKMLTDTGHTPHLAAVLVGDDPASQTYVGGKEKACKEVGFISTVYRLSAKTSEAELLKTIDFLNHDNEIDGFIVQLPLPAHIDGQKVIAAIDPAKDVDGFHPVNLGRMLLNVPSYLPATPYGIMELLRYYKIETAGKTCVIAGRSNIVGTPLSVLLSRNASPGNCTVTLCHSKTRNLADVTRQADILVGAVGKLEMITADMVKEGAVVIDVGIHRVEDATTQSGFRLRGDVKYDEVAKKCSYITPVPGGVGPMTITCLLQNTLSAAKKQFFK